MYVILPIVNFSGTHILGCWYPVKIETVYHGNVKEIENIGLPNECQEHCASDTNCKGFVHQFSNQTCWLKLDTNTIVGSNADVYVGPKNCSDVKGNNLYSLYF